MKIQTKFFGEIEISEDDIIIFDSGIPGFENVNKYVILSIDGVENLKCIQSLDNTDVNLLLISPWSYFPDYEINLSDEEIKELDIKGQEEVQVYNIITVREEKITVNLVAPVVINVIKKLGKQIILSNSEYKVRQEITCL